MADNKLYSVMIEHTYQSKGQPEKKLVEVAVGFGNSKGGLSFQLPSGMQLTDQARIVIFPIDKKDSD